MIWLLASSKDSVTHAAKKERVGTHLPGQEKWRRVKFTALCSERYTHFLDAQETTWSARQGEWSDVTCERCKAVPRGYALEIGMYKRRGCEPLVYGGR